MTEEPEQLTMFTDDECSMPACNGPGQHEFWIAGPTGSPVHNLGHLCRRHRRQLAKESSELGWKYWWQDRLT